MTKVPLSTSHVAFILEGKSVINSYAFFSVQITFYLFSGTGEKKKKDYQCS